jgi:hypothetical protein
MMLTKTSVEKMKKIYIVAQIFVVALVFAACEKEDELILPRVASPVLLVTEDGTDNVMAYFYELDKSGILNQSVGIDTIPVAGLSIEVFAAGVTLGSFETGTDGAISIDFTDTKPNEYAGEYKGIAFRIFK